MSCRKNWQERLDLGSLIQFPISLGTRSPIRHHWSAWGCSGGSRALLGTSGFLLHAQRNAHAAAVVPSGSHLFITLSPVTAGPAAQKQHLLQVRWGGERGPGASAGQFPRGKVWQMAKGTSWTRDQGQGGMCLLVAEGQDFSIVIPHAMAIFEPSECWGVQRGTR